MYDKIHHKLKKKKKKKDFQTIFTPFTVETKLYTYYNYKVFASLS